jgi:hypothetical protein
MEESGGKKMGEQGKNSRESKPQKMLAKLPSNYSSLDEECQAAVRKEICEALIAGLKQRGERPQLTD